MRDEANGSRSRIRDVGAFWVGAFMLLEQTIQEVAFGVAPNTLIVGGGLAAWGVTASGSAARYLKKKVDEE